MVQMLITYVITYLFAYKVGQNLILFQNKSDYQ